jgi:hypothetical protein
VVAARKRRIYVLVDIAKAFATPSLVAAINSNASVETLLQEVENPKVRYGAVWDAETDFENSVVILSFDALDMYKKPQPCQRVD